MLKRFLAALLAAFVAWGSEAAASDFEALPRPPAPSHYAAYACFLAGAGLIGVSFPLARRADHAYDRYLVANTESEVVRLFDESAHYDRLASASLLSGEVLIAAGLYLRFIRHPARVELSLGSRRCGVSYRF
jgi:hypothetical protein